MNTISTPSAQPSTSYPSYPNMQTIPIYPPVPLTRPGQADSSKKSKLSESAPFGNEYRLESQNCGTFLIIFFLIITVLSLFSSISAYQVCNFAAECIAITLNVIGQVMYFIFFLYAVNEAEFLAGRPTITKFCLPIANYVTNLFRAVFIFAKIHHSSNLFFNELVVETLIIAAVLFLYKHDDDSNSAMLYSKPWIYRKVEVFFYPFPSNYPYQFPPPMQTIQKQTPV